MTSTFDFAQRSAGWFRLIAFAEAVSWVGLLVGMYFKYLGAPQTELGVKIFGPVHGRDLHRLPGGRVAGRDGVQVAPGTWLLALLGSIVPLGSVIFLIWADRTGRMGPRGERHPRRSTTGTGRPVPKRRDRLVGVTRPRPSIGPALAGAVDLSALKQRHRRRDGAAPGRPRPGGVEITEANFEAEVLVRSNEVPVVVLLWSPRSEASIQLGEVLAAWRTPTAASGRWRRSTSTPCRGWRRCSACRPFRRSSRWPPASRCRASRACSHPSSCGAGSTRCSRPPRASSAARRCRGRRGGRPRAGAGARASRRRRLRRGTRRLSGDPRRQAQPCRGQGRGAPDRLPAAGDRPTAGRRAHAPTPHPTTSTRRSPRPTSRSCSRTSQRPSTRLIALGQAHRG